ncbi:hypothetical protein JCM10450v2_000824 [Rhodotorula kratochvilovae]
MPRNNTGKAMGIPPKNQHVRWDPRARPPRPAPSSSVDAAPAPGHRKKHRQPAQTHSADSWQPAHLHRFDRNSSAWVPLTLDDAGPLPRDAPLLANSTTEGKTRLTVLTYNTWSSSPTHSPTQSRAILALLRDARADLIALQEVTSRFFALLLAEPWLRTGGWALTTPEAFFRAAGHGAKHRGKEGEDESCVLLVREGLLGRGSEVRMRRLERARDEGGKAAIALRLFSGGEERVRLATSHFSSLPNNVALRGRQYNTCLSFLSASAPPPSSATTPSAPPPLRLFLGDFNASTHAELLPLNAPPHSLSDACPSAPSPRVLNAAPHAASFAAPPTFGHLYPLVTPHSRKPRKPRRIDRVYFGGAGARVTRPPAAMPSLHDTRLLANLLKTEKDALTAFKHYSLTAATAGSALSAWSVADSADTGDLMDAAIRISQLLATCSDSQRLYLQALSAYRAALKEVLAREQALRTVVRDREILVNRLIKIGNKKPKDGHEADHQAKLDDAQRELQACETFLQEEEAALATAKRRSFRGALQHRMKAMAELARVMEDCAAEAVAILSQLPAPEGDEDEYDATTAQAYDLASDAGDSIAPSQSASQAMSRASSSSSLDEQYHANAPPIPDNLRIDPSSAPSRARSASPPPVGAKSPLRAPVNAPQPVMPAVPTAPPPISNKVYVERVAGLPTFDIPRAPDLSRRPDDSSDESDYGDEPAGAAPAVSAAVRSRHYPLDSPPRPQQQQQQQSSLLRRRAMSDTSSINDGGRKRRGSFFGGIASLFHRNKSSSRGGAREREREPSGGSAPPEFDYAGARSRLAQSGGADAAAAEGRNDAVLRSVLNAGKLPSRRRAGGDSSDEDDRRQTVRHVNDPGARLKALSDVGRSPAPSRAIPAAAAPAPARPKLQRKGTSASTVRPLSVVESAATTATKKKTRKVKKAASDIGPASSAPVGWSTGPPPTAAGATLQVPRAPARGDGIAGLARGSTLPSASLAPPVPIQAPAFALRSSTGGTPAAPAETGSLRRKKTKRAGAVVPSETVVLSAEALGIPTSAGGTPNGLSRSNTTSTTATATERKMKKKKAKSLAPPAAVNGAAPTFPTQDELAASLPKSQTNGSALTAQLPRPDDDPYTSTLAARPLSVAAPAPPPAQASAQDAANKPVKALADKEKKSKRLSALHGVTNDNWVANPTAHAPHTRATPAQVAHPRRAEGHEGEESLLAVVDRAEGNERPSRSYGPALTTSGLAPPSSGANGSLPSPTGPLNASLPSAPPAQADLPVAQAVLPRPPAPAETPQLTKRKSVRLADAADPAPPPAPLATLSPSGSIRSSSSAGQPRHGILIQRDPSPAPGSVAASLSASPAFVRNRGESPSRAPRGNDGAWPTRASIRRAMADSSSDESGGEGRRAYRQARKLLGRGTKDMEDAMQGRKPPTREEKGKGRAMDA